MNSGPSGDCREPKSTMNDEMVFLEIKKILSESVSDRQVTRENIKGNGILTDEEAFLERIATFTSYHWSVKPKRISPPACARYGWWVAGRDLLQCTSCQQFVSAEIPPVWSHELYSEAVSRLERSLTEGHHKYCPWPTNPSLGNYLREVLFRQDQTVTEFWSRLKDLEDLGSQLPLVERDLPQPLTRDQVAIWRFPRLADAQYEAIVLALTGWMRMKSDVPLSAVSCRWCLRKAELTFYLQSSGAAALPDENGVERNGTEEEAAMDATTADNDDDDDDTEQPQPKKLYKFEARSFHPLDEHQNWCPWIAECGGPDAHDKVECGWKVLLDILQRHATDYDVPATNLSETPARIPPEKAVSPDGLATPRKTVQAAKKLIKGCVWDAAAPSPGPV